MATTKKATKSKATETACDYIKLPGIDVGLLTINIVGDSPIIIHKWSEKAKKQMLDKMMQKATSGREIKNPLREFVDALYWLDESGNMIDTPEELNGITNETPKEEIDAVLKKGRFGFPTCAFKAAAIDAGYQQGVIAKKTTARGAFHILGEYAVIEGDIPEIREDMVQVGGMSKVAYIRYRPEIKNWHTTLMIRYNKKAISKEQIMNLMNYGGFACGVGEWRPSRDGSFGTFHCE